ncbi:hypothetical protein D187_004789 [Cystobacter fuscus DSM 2262]|uniref:Uncharacterized protein n=1 Tax=Cystobacter fuscus (strain ATCC 25194 / DSM 2262 / NBRC 100088 / M29) TaxID=1242864 RepID=S9NZN7_CYSF2|nr:hypothetical protein [Cystobacter fuscus]EPX57650.1 hypothetical protein D187_004789 [Cystobacter fuscus DSM 2262]
MAACSGDGFPWLLPDPDEDTPPMLGRCQVDEDCPDPRLFICDTASASCQAACRTREDCMAARRGPAYRLSACDDNPLGCQCDDNQQCVEAMCSADEECAASGQVCRDGRCTNSPVARARTCRVTPDHVVGRVGSRVRFSLLAWDETGEPVAVSPAEQRWTALEASVSVDAGGSSFVLSAPTSEPRETVRAEIGGAVCTARVRVLEALEPGRMRVVVTDEQTGRPISGARVVVADAAGAVTGEALTDEGGVALPTGGAKAGSVSVFHEDFDYLTVAHAGETGPGELSLPLRRNPTGRTGGFEGTVQGLSERLTMHMGVAGLSSPDEGPGAAASSLLEPERQVDFLSAGQRRVATLPAGAFAVLAGSTLRELDVQGRGSAGVCDEETRTRDGTCGVRTAWGLGGELPVNALQLGGGVDVGSLLARAMPSLRTFKSWVVRDARFTLEEGPGAFTRLAPDFSDARSMALGFPFVLRVPALPVHQGRYLDSVWVLGSARVPGRGGVPLGLGLGMNTGLADPNTQPVPFASGLVRVRMAPTHHGLEGSPYVLHLTASSSEGAVSGLIQRTLKTLPFDPTGAAPVEIQGPFLPVPEGARYSPVDDEGGRWLRPPTAPGLPPGTVLRAVFSNGAGRRWVVLLDTSRDSQGVRLPMPPAPLEDRTFQGNHLGSFASLELQAWSLREGGLPDGELLPLEALTRDEHLSRLGELVVAWSALTVTP